MTAYSWPYDNPVTLSPPDQSYFHHPHHHPHHSPPPVASHWPATAPPANVHVPQDQNGGEPPSSASAGDNNSHESSSPPRGYPPAPPPPHYPTHSHHHHHMVGPPQPPPPYHAHHPHYQPHPQHPNHNMGGNHHGWGQYGNGYPPHHHRSHPHPQQHPQQHQHHHHRPRPIMDGRSGPTTLRSADGSRCADPHLQPAGGAESDQHPEAPRGGSTEAALLLPEDRPLLTDYFYLLIQQLRVCRFAEGDRKSRGGKRGNITVGYGGLECTHCAAGAGGEHNGGACCGTPRKFFWTNVDRFSNSFAGIAEHVLKCINCPDDVRATLEDLKTRHREQMAKLPKGSQKEFFRRMWGRLHPNSGSGNGGGEGGGGGGGGDHRQRHPPTSLSPPSVAADGTGVPPQRQQRQQQQQQQHRPPHQRRLPLRSSGENNSAPTNYFAAIHDQGNALGGHHHHHHQRNHDQLHAPTSSCPPGALVLPEDRVLLTDYFYFLNQQLKFCRFAEKDRKSRGGKRGNIVIGYGGLECRHCAVAASGTAGDELSSTTPSSTPRKFFWTNVDRFSNSFAGIAEHVMKCINCPDHVKAALDDLKLYHREQMAKLPKGSQKIFFQRLWSRLHPDGGDDAAGDGSGHHQQQPQPQQQRQDHPPRGIDSQGDFHAPVSRAPELQGQGQGSLAPAERREEGGGGGTGQAEAGGDDAAAGRSSGCLEEELQGQEMLPELPLVSFSFEASSEGRNKRKVEAGTAENEHEDTNPRAAKKRTLDPKE